MVTILVAVICLHTMCTSITVPTLVNFSPYECSHFGYFKAVEFAPKNWRVASVECVNGREV